MRLGFPELLRRLRSQHNITQRELADKIGVDYTYISKIENEALDPPSEETLIKMAYVFGVDKYDFIMAAGKLPRDFEFVVKTDEEIQKMIKERLRKEERG